MTKSLIKSFLCFFLLVSVASCTFNDKKKDLNRLQDNDVAVVIGGCGNHEENTFLQPKSQCHMTWKNNKGDILLIEDTMSVHFIKSGDYDFIRYEDRKLKYQKAPNAISIFNKISIKSGSVIYMGNLIVQSKKKGKSILHSISFSNNLDSAKKHLERSYPSLADKIKTIEVDFSDDAKAIKKLLENIR